MKLLLRHYGIETTEIPDVHVGHSGPPPPPSRRASEGIRMEPSVEALPTTSVSLPRHSWPNTGGMEPGVSRAQVGGVMTGLSRGQGFAAALNPLQVYVCRVLVCN